MYKMNERGGTSKNEKVAVIDECDEGHFPHLDFDFLQPDKIRDANGRLASDPDYCPRTLFVPEAFLKQQTPGRLLVVADFPQALHSPHTFFCEDNFVIILLSALILSFDLS